jgi:hypothetical protein
MQPALASAYSTAPAPWERGPTEVFFYQRDDLLLAFSAPASEWVAVKLEGSEMVKGSDWGGQVAVVATDKRVLGFSARTGYWAEMKLDYGEEPLDLKARGTVGVVETNRRALGFSAVSGTWNAEDLFYTEY